MAGRAGLARVLEPGPALEQRQVRSADAAALDPEPDLTGLRLRRLDLGERRPAGLDHDRRAHQAAATSRTPCSAASQRWSCLSPSCGATFGAQPVARAKLLVSDTY